MTRLLVLCLLVFVLACMPVAAQEVVPEPVPDAKVVMELWQLVGGLIAAVSAGGIVGAAGVGVLASRLRNDAATMAAIEGLAKSAPPDLVKLIAVLGQSSIEVGKLIDEATDGIPANSKSTTKQL